MRNLINIEEHQAKFQEKMNQLRGPHSKGGRKSLQSKSQTNRQSDDDPSSNIFGSYTNVVKEDDIPQNFQLNLHQRPSVNKE
mmetsp:Transcript_30392/g.22553  ORF Transcript_30392/g.22553 Transcript_30392/m.22553 type:complete len:82 (-) Transcript_30392:19-264(-)